MFRQPDMLPRPADLPHAVPLRQLLEALYDHQSWLSNARHGIGDPAAGRAARPARRRAARVPTRAERMLASRWLNVADALTYGATLDRVAGTRGRGLRVIGTRRAIGEL